MTAPSLPITETDEWQHLPANRSAAAHRALVTSVARSQAWDLVLQVRVAEMISQEIPSDTAKKLVDTFTGQLAKFTSTVDRFDQWIPAAAAARFPDAAAEAPPAESDTQAPAADLTGIDQQELREAAARVRTQRLVILGDRERLGFPDDDPESAAIRREVNSLTSLVGDGIPQ